MDELLVEYIGPARESKGVIRMLIQTRTYVFSPETQYRQRVKESHFAARIAALPEKWRVIEDPTPETPVTEADTAEYDELLALHERVAQGGKLSKRERERYSALQEQYGAVESEDAPLHDGID